MTDVTVRIPGLLARFTDGHRTIEVRADTVKECLERLVEDQPALEPHLFDKRGDFRDHLQIFVDDRNAEWFDEQPIHLDSGTTVTILQAVSGG